MKCKKASKNNLKPHGNDNMKKEHTTIDKAQSEFKNAQIFVGVEVYGSIDKQNLLNNLQILIMHL